MTWSWFTTTFTAAGIVVLSAIAMYLGMIIYTRLAGLRSFAKISAFDFAITVGIGTVLASAIIEDRPSVLRALVALGALYGLQFLVGVLRRRSDFVLHAMENRPVLLMAGGRIIHENMRAAQMTEDDLRAKLRGASVLDRNRVLAVVMETTGDVSVLQGGAGETELDPWLFRGVAGSAQLSGQASDDTPNALPGC